MAYRTLDYTYYNNQHDIERLAAEILQATHVNPNTQTLSNWKALVVTWKIIDNETPTKVIDNHIPLNKLKKRSHKTTFEIKSRIAVNIIFIPRTLLVLNKSLL